MLQPPLVLSPLHFQLSQIQAEVSAAVGVPVMVTVTIGYDGVLSEVKLVTPEGDDGYHQSWALEEALQQATDMLVGMQEARLIYLELFSAENQP